jgi:subtilisin family serine protease
MGVDGSGNPIVVAILDTGIHSGHEDLESKRSGDGYDFVGDDGDPDNKVRIGGDDDCDHETYRRFGSDGGGNIYFRCTNCSNVILNYDSTGGDSTSERTAPELTPDTDDGPKHDPLMKGLSLGSDDSGESTRPNDEGDGGVVQRLKTDLRRLFGKDR